MSGRATHHDSFALGEIWMCFELQDSSVHNNTELGIVDKPGSEDVADAINPWQTSRNNSPESRSVLLRRPRLAVRAYERFVARLSAHSKDVLLAFARRRHFVFVCKAEQPMTTDAVTAVGVTSR